MADSERLVAAARELRTKLIADPHRPRYHFVTPEGFCMPFDPNGAICWKGRYHLMYIFQDAGRHCWGHASSVDLVHWTFHPAALEPRPADPDTGIFSGNAFANKKGEATILYHGVQAGNCIATSSDEDLVRWAKMPTNPIVPIPKKDDPDFGKYTSWDPHGWLQGDTYYAVFGGAKATLFKSSDLARWEYVSPFIGPDARWTDSDEDCSCPDFFPLGDKWMLLCISHKRGCRYYLGQFKGERFIPEMHGRMNWPGGTFFAPESLLDGKGRRIFWAWVLDRRPGNVVRASGWSGEMSLPRVLSLDRDGTLRIEPAEELKMLRLNPRRREDVALAADSDIAIEDVRGDCLELSVEIEPQGAREVGVKVRRSSGGEEQTVIACNPQARTLGIDLSKSSLDPRIEHRTFCMTRAENPIVKAQEAPFELRTGETLKLRIFLDRSMLEVFANGRQCVTQHIYPARQDSLGISVFARGGAARVRVFEAWDMAAANPW
jgi:sucrose-6-phosphate hydrolase SacC (GH32 family)